MKYKMFTFFKYTKSNVNKKITFEAINIDTQN